MRFQCADLQNKVRGDAMVTRVFWPRWLFTERTHSHLAYVSKTAIPCYSLIKITGSRVLMPTVTRFQKESWRRSRKINTTSLMISLMAGKDTHANAVSRHHFPDYLI